MSGLMTLEGITLLNRIPTSVNRPILTPAARALIHNITGTNVKSIANAISITAMMIIGMIYNSIYSHPIFILFIFLTTIRFHYYLIFFSFNSLSLYNLFSLHY